LTRRSPSSHILHLHDGKFCHAAPLLNRLAGTGCGAYVSTFKSSSLALVCPAAEYFSPAWSRSRNAKDVDVAMNSAFRTITECLKPTPTQYLSILQALPSFSLTKYRSPPTSLEVGYTLTEHFNSNLVGSSSTFILHPTTWLVKKLWPRHEVSRTFVT